MSQPTQLTLIQQIESLALRTVGTEFHGAVMDLRASYLSDFANMRREATQDMAKIVVPIIAKQFDVEADVLLSADRSKRVTHARHVAMWILRRVGALSYPVIAEALNRLDHTTAYHGFVRIEAKRKGDSGYRARIDALVQLCTDAIDRASREMAA